MQLISNMPRASGDSWVAYVDLLGVAEKTRVQGLGGVIPIYEAIVTRIDSLFQNNSKPRYMWFSDTFLFYTPPNSNLSFNSIDWVKNLLDYVIQRGICPFRGAVAYGEFWADEDNRIWAGRAFLEAHQYAEAQDWIVFVLAPSALRQICTRPNREGILRQHYRKVKVPLKSKCSGSQTDMTDELYAFRFGSFGNMGQENCLTNLQSMQEQAKQAGSDPSVLSKYDRTIRFLRENQ